MNNIKMSRTLIIARTAILMAIVFALQYMILKFAPASIITTIITGSVVNMVLLLALHSVGFFGAAFIGILTPVMAFLQGKLPIALLIPIVAISNIIIILVCFFVRKMFCRFCDAEHNVKLWYVTEISAVIAGTLLKFGFMFVSIMTYVPLFPGIKPPMVKSLSISWSFPQLVAGIVGGILSMLLYRGLLRTGSLKSQKKTKTAVTAGGEITQNASPDISEESARTGILVVSEKDKENEENNR